MRFKSWVLIGLIALLGAPPVAAGDSADRTHEFRVTGMTCTLCPIRIEKGLQGIEGVRSVSVDQEAERVSVIAQEVVSAQELESAIEGAGHFEAELLVARSRTDGTE